MLEYKINPHFVTFYGSARNCSFKQLLTILEYNTQDKTTGKPMNNNSLEEVLIRNTWWITTLIPSGKHKLNQTSKWQ